MKVTQTRTVAEKVGKMLGLWIYFEEKATDSSGSLGVGGEDEE